MGGAIKYDARCTKKEHNETCGGQDESEERDKEEESERSRAHKKMNCCAAFNS